MLNKIVVYSKQNCQYCEMLKSFLDENEFDYEIKDVTIYENLQELKLAAPHVKTVPQMFVNDFHVGGCRDSIEFLKSSISIIDWAENNHEVKVA